MVTFSIIIVVSFSVIIYRFEVEADYVLQATGRPVNYENMGLEALGIEAGPRGIKVDDHMRTSVKNIFATGDAVDKRILN